MPKTEKGRVFPGCSCGPEVLPQEYRNQITISDLPTHMEDCKLSAGGASSICLDFCIAGEVIQLWSVGITTTGCCCGHSRGLEYIGVIPEHEYRMVELGYEYINKSNGSFKPKSI